MGDVVPLFGKRRPEVSLVAPDGTPPPHALEAEAALIGDAFLVPEGDDDATKAQHARLDRVHETVRPDMFFDPMRGRVWKAIQELRASSAPIDIVTVHRFCASQAWAPPPGGWSTYLAQHADATPAVGNVEAHARAVIDTWELREIIAACLVVQAEARSPVADHDAAKANWRRDLGRVTAPREQLAGRPVGAVVAEARAHVHAAASGRVVGVRYPWPAVEQLVGLLVRGRQTILAGLSEHGKTALAMQIVCSVASANVDATGYGEAAYIMTGEMPGAALLLRTACSMAGVDVARVDAGLVTIDEHARIDHWMRELGSLPLIIDDQPAPAHEVAKRVRSHKAAFEAGRARNHKGDLMPKCRLQLAMGDHVQDLADLEQGRDEKDRIFRCAKGWVDGIAKHCDVATLLLSQLRSIEHRSPAPKFPPWPTEEQLFGAPNALKRTADTIIAVQRPELLMRGKIPARWLGVAAVSRLKSRFGGGGRRALLGFDRGMFTNDLPAAARGEAYYDDDDDA